MHLIRYLETSVAENVDFIFIDSGTGGLPYMHHLIRKSPHARCIYVADTKNFPYGEKSHAEITLAASLALQSLFKKYTPRAVVISCNTLSIVALAFFRKQFPNIAFVGTVPAIKLAGEQSLSRSIGLLATNRTVESAYVQNLINDFASDCEIVFRGDPELISFIENSFFFASEAQKEEAVKPAIEYFKTTNVDTIVLGCTHFLHIVDISIKLASPKIKIIDSCAGVVNQALRIAPIDETKKSEFFSPLFYVTGKDGEKDDVAFHERYQTIAKKMGITYGGIITNY